MTVTTTRKAINSDHIATEYPHPTTFKPGQHQPHRTPSSMTTLLVAALIVLISIHHIKTLKGLYRIMALVSIEQDDLDNIAASLETLATTITGIDTTPLASADETKLNQAVTDLSAAVQKVAPPAAPPADAPPADGTDAPADPAPAS